MKAILKLIYNVIKKQALYKKNCKFEEKTVINPKCKFEGHNLVGYGTYLSNVKLGYGSYLADSCFLRNVAVGRFSSIGSNVRVAIGRHPTSDFVSTHPSFFSTTPIVGLRYVEKQRFEEIHFPKDVANYGEKYEIIVGNDVWIGSGVTMADGVTIGDGAIVGAGAFVANDIKPYEIAVGIPAKPVRKRFSEDDISFLLNLRWWDKPEAWIRNYAKYFENIKELRKQLERRKEG